jgi:DNA-binding transcriptional LysR family regulator
MDIRYLFEFVNVADKLNFSDAADDLFMSQATLSKHIASMEDELGCKLFDRSTHQVALTESGKMLLATAEVITKEYHACLDELDRRKAIRQKTIRIASIPVIEPYGISDLVIQFQKEHPAIDMQVREIEERDIPQLLQCGECDLAFQRLNKNDMKEYHAVPYCSDELVAVVPKDHKLLAYKTIPLSMLKDEPFLIMDENTALYELCVNACKQAGFEPKITYKGHRPENIMGLVAKGMGVSLLLKKEVDFFVNPGIQSIKLAQPIKSEIYLTNPKQTSLQYPYHIFVDYVKKLSE